MIINGTLNELIFMDGNVFIKHHDLEYFELSTHLDRCQVVEISFYADVPDRMMASDIVIAIATNKPLQFCNSNQWYSGNSNENLFILLCTKKHRALIYQTYKLTTAPSTLY